ncbi:DEAD/DEAH box helicase [Parabacteroides distasonis]|nr:DEAD/DEAH box helicase [Parabacteroides distasonis]
MLIQSYNHIGITFTVNIDGHSIHFHEWSATDDCIYYQPLAALVDNGQAQFYKSECTVPYANLYLLDENEQSILGVPNLYDKAMRLRGEGMLNSSDFRYRIELLQHIPDGQLLIHERIGNIVKTKEGDYLLSEAQYELINRVEAFNSLPADQKTADYNFRQFAAIKALAKEARCELDSYLENENVFVPQKITLDMGRDEDGFTLEPSIEIPENDKFQHTFDRMRKVQSSYPISRENGERIRVVFSPEQQENLSVLKQSGRHKTHEEMQAIIEHPTEYFDPEVINLDELYSDRVIEIGVYKPKFYPFICPYKSCWIAGATIETPENGTTKLTIESDEELYALQEAVDFAKQEGKKIVCYKQTQIDIDDALFLIETAEKQLRNPQGPIQTDENKIDESRKILIIKDNAEKTDFAVQNRIIERTDRYTLFKDPFLDTKYTLKSHQEEGVAWLQHLYQNNVSGCLIADDMGLGKTLQILYFIDWHSRMYADHKPYLIVAPVSLLENWENEYKRFFSSPRLTVTRMRSKSVPRQFDKKVVDAMQKLDIVLTSYEVLRNSQLNFCAVDFDIIAMDEAQKIKSPGTLVTNAAKALKGKFKIAMTGTPVENTLVDLWCIMDFCVPGLLGNAKAFAAKYQNPLKNADTDLVTLGNELHHKLGSYFIRRLKSDAAKDLPEKIVHKQPIEMPTSQSSIYKRVVNAHKSGLQRNMLVTIMQIRAVSEHPYLLNSSLMEHNLQEIVDSSARMQATITILDQIKQKDEKVIIFAERKETQKILWNVCHKRYRIAPKVINGDTPSTVTRPNPNNLSRQASIDEFQSVEGFNVIIMSPVAAGIGLNVTAANHVIHYARHWNPAKENQATDRAYRIGQTKTVFVYYPMAVSKEFKSFDETLDELLSRKTSLATCTLFPTERVEVKQDEIGQLLLGK